MIKYIIEILKLQSSLILPGFGSLQVNTKTGKIGFNPLLKFNDGTLAKYIAQKEGTDQQAAQNQIAKFIREIEAELGKGNSYDMFQFGKFEKNKKGEIEFIQDPASIQIPVETKKTKTETPVAEKIIKPAAKKTEPVVAKIEKQVVEKEIIPIKETAAKEVKKVEVAAPEKTVTSVEEKIISKTEKEIPVLTEKPKIKAEEIKAAVTPVAEPKKIEAEIKEELKVKKEAEKIIEVTEIKQAKNSFTPSGNDALEKIDSAKEKIKEETKIPEINQAIPLAEASKKDPTAQEKNKFVPPVEGEKVVAATDRKVETPKVMAASIKEVVTEEKITEEKETTKEKFKKHKPQKVKNEVPKEKKKRSRWPLMIIIIIILGGGATAYWFYQDQVNAFLFAGVGSHDSDSTATAHGEDSLKTEHPVINEHPEDSAIIEEPIVEEVIEEPIVEEVVEEPVKEKPVKEQPVVDHSSSGGSYHIIGNSFSSKSNAENYAEKMNGKGYQAKVLGKFDNLYLVSIKSYNSREEAKSGLSSVSADAASAWVFKY